VTQQKRVDKKLGIRIEKRIKEASPIDVSFRHPELLAKKLGINDPGHVGLMWAQKNRDDKVPAQHHK
jgi:hypothetical protein